MGIETDTQEPVAKVQRAYQAGREGFVIFYDGFGRVAIGEISLGNDARLQDELNSEGRSHPRNFLKLSDAEFYQIGPKGEYHRTKSTQERGKRTLSTKVKSMDIIYPLSDFRKDEYADASISGLYPIRVRISLNKLKNDIEGEILLHRFFKDKDQHVQLNDIFESRNFVAVINPKHSGLEQRISQVTRVQIQRPILISTDKIRNYEILDENGSETGSAE